MQNNLLSLLGGLLLAGKGGQGAEIQTRATEVDSKNYNYQLYVPTRLQNKPDAPIIVFLHGIRERGSGGFVPATGPLGMLIKPYLEKSPGIILLPQCRPNIYWSDPLMERMVIQTIDQTVREFGADEKRIYLAGVSMGGYGVWHFAAQHPDKFAALIPICGGSSIMTGDRFNPVAKKIGKTPAWVFHGEADKVVPVSESRNMVEAINANHGNVKYSEYEGVGHDVWRKVLTEKNLMPWLLSQKRSV